MERRWRGEGPSTARGCAGCELKINDAFARRSFYERDGTGAPGRSDAVRHREPERQDPGGVGALAEPWTPASEGGENAGPFRPAVAGFGPQGDREGWFDFLDECRAILDEYGDIPFVHWATYEQVKLDTYITRYGDPNGIAARVKGNLLDLLPITRASIAVPVSSYSLKDVETVAGYERQLEEYGGNWSMAKYIEATECNDKLERAAIIDEILAYNREDLEATWAVKEWLRGFNSQSRCPSRAQNPANSAENGSHTP